MKRLKIFIHYIYLQVCDFYFKLSIFCQNYFSMFTLIKYRLTRNIHFSIVKLQISFQLLLGANNIVIRAIIDFNFWLYASLKKKKTVITWSITVIEKKMLVLK